MAIQRYSAKIQEEIKLSTDIKNGHRSVFEVKKSNCSKKVTMIRIQCTVALKDMLRDTIFYHEQLRTGLERQWRVLPNTHVLQKLHASK